MKSTMKSRMQHSTDEQRERARESERMTKQIFAADIVVWTFDNCIGAGRAANAFANCFDVCLCVSLQNTRRHC